MFWEQKNGLIKDKSQKSVQKIFFLILTVAKANLIDYDFQNVHLNNKGNYSIMIIEHFKYLEIGNNNCNYHNFFQPS